jgi:hypothetical protein
MAGLVPAIHAAPPQSRLWSWRRPLQQAATAIFFASADYLRRLEPAMGRLRYSAILARRKMTPSEQRAGLAIPIG